MTEFNSKPFAEQEGNQGNVGKHKPDENKSPTSLKSMVANLIAGLHLLLMKPT